MEPPNQHPYLAFAPLQGYTNAAFRRAHWENAGGVDEYYTPFVRIEKGVVRAKDLRDTALDLNEGIPTVPQVIANGSTEFAQLCDALQKQGWKRIDLNMGCPFPMQTRAGRGSGLLQHPNQVEDFLREMNRRPDVAFSVKMRLGQESADEGIAVLPIINEMPLVHVTLHPRLGCQQYKGLPDLDTFRIFYEKCTHPMVYNGNIDSLDPAVLQLPPVKGLMIGRGLLAHPWMTSDKDPLKVLSGMHQSVYRHCTGHLCGETQILNHLHAFWEYMDIDHKSKKAILKSSSLHRYNEAVSLLFRRIPC